MKNKDAIPRIQARLPFKGNNMFGETVHGCGYAVYSYGYHFPMAVYDGYAWYINEDRYSKSTGRHQTYIRMAVQGAEATTSFLTKLIADGVNERPAQKALL